MSGDDHRPSKPSWRCSSCGEPWPCGPARAQITAEMAGTDMELMMSIDMIEAARDDHSVRPIELIERFLRWGTC